MKTQIILVCLILFSVSRCQLDQGQLQKVLETGRSHYETYQSQAERDGCWRKAVSSLNETCRDLDQAARQRLAIAFANCHWLSAERRTYKCTDEMSIASCTSEMSDSAFDVYTQFFNHIEDACFYLQSQLWQEKTERLITDLSDTSEEAVKKISESLKRHNILQKGQAESLANQNQLIKNGQQLQNQLDSARQEVSSAFTSIQQQAWSFKEQFHEIFISLSDGLDRIHLVLTLLLGEFISIERFVVFIVGMVTAYLLTCSQYTARARPLLMMAIIIESLFLERLIVNWYVNGENTTSVMEGLHFILWIVRYITAFTCSLLLMYFYMSYCNYEVVNHQLLKKIIEQNRQIKRHLNLDTEENVDEVSQFIPATTSTPSTKAPSITNEVAVVPKPVVSQLPFQNEISRPRHDSVDQPATDSGIEEVNDQTKEDTPTICRYNLRRRCKKGHHHSNKILEHESPEQFAHVVYENERLTRQGLRYHDSNNKTPCSAAKTHSFNILHRM